MSIDFVPIVSSYNGEPHRNRLFEIGGFILPAPPKKSKKEARPQEGSGEECGRGLGIAKKNDIMQLQFNSNLTRFVLTNRRYGHTVPLKHKELLVRVLL